jgi:putative glycosyltransferase (TIGR04348 family)
VTPAPHGSQAGNRITALRWAGLLRQLGARPRVLSHWDEQPCDLLVAVHAEKSAASVAQCAQRSPLTPIVVLLAGTDVYPEFSPAASTLAALEHADVLIALQPRARDVLPPHLQAKVRTIVQSATSLANAPQPPPPPPLLACVLAHLRPVKAPLLPFAALATIPDLAIELTLAGRALTPDLAAAAQAATELDPRAHWLGELHRSEARRLLAASHVCIVPSAAEGGANVVSEAIAAGTPVIASRVPGNLGLLGEDWPATFSVGDARGLGALLRRTATDSTFHQLLILKTQELQHLVVPARERAAWAKLLSDLGLRA